MTKVMGWIVIAACAAGFAGGCGPSPSSPSSPSDAPSSTSPQTPAALDPCSLLSTDEWSALADEPLDYNAGTQNHAWGTSACSYADATRLQAESIASVMAVSARTWLERIPEVLALSGADPEQMEDIEAARQLVGIEEGETPDAEAACDVWKVSRAGAIRAEDGRYVEQRRLDDEVALVRVESCADDVVSQVELSSPEAMSDQALERAGSAIERVERKARAALQDGRL